jgi:excinuclease ABC subunit B
MDIIIPSMIDRDMAPPGHHVMSCFVQYAPYDIEGGWDDAKREAFGETVIDTIERVEILRSLRAGEFDILVGINLLREGLDLPEVSLVCVLDADKEGFLRSRTSLIQTAGRAARHVNGEVVLFADKITGSIRALLDVTEDRRRRQMEHNREHGITPHSVKRPVQESLRVILEGNDSDSARIQETPLDVATLIRELELEMKEASGKMEYERAALLRDQIMELKGGGAVTSSMTNRPKSKGSKPAKSGKARKDWKR